MVELWNALLEGFGQLLALFYGVVPNYGVAILMLTLAVRVAMLPLTFRQFRSMQAMQALQPELKKLQQKYPGKENRQKLTEETMKMYREHGANPLGGCLPLLLQLPVFYALFRVLDSCRGEAKAAGDCVTGLRYLPESTALYAAIEVGSAGFLGMNLVLTPSEALGQVGVLGSVPYLLLVGLMAGTGWFQQKQSQKMQTAVPEGPQAQMQKQMQSAFKFMPLLFAFFSFTFPAGLTVYWVASNTWQIGQQHLMLRQRGGPEGQAAAAPAGGNPKEPEGGKDDGEAPRKSPPRKPKGSGARKRRKRR